MKMRTIVSSLVLMMATSIIVVTSQDDGWTGCINQSLNKNQNLVRIQQPSRVCLSIANDTNWNSGSTSYIRASFEPKADEYSRFHIPNCTFWITHSLNYYVEGIDYSFLLFVKLKYLFFLSYSIQQHTAI